MPMIINGIGVSHGTAQGRVHLFRRGHGDIVRYELEAKQVQPEIERLADALETARTQLRSVSALVPPKTRREVMGFIESHLLMLDDALLSERPSEIIRTEHCNAEWALKMTLDELVSVFEAMEDAYLRTRANDVQHVINTVQDILGRDDGNPQEPLTDLTGHIVVADDLTPADTVEMQHQNVAGFVTRFGSSMSHTAILARSLGIPAVVGIHDAADLIADSETMLIDAHGGILLFATDDWLIDQYRDLQRREQEHTENLLVLRDRPAITLDRQPITLKCNVDLLEEIEEVHEVHADGVGLYRTEFFYLGRDQCADSDEQYETYRSMVEALDGKPLTIRTLDLGADKEFDPKYEGAIAPNPALGLRAIRRSLRDKVSFNTQLLAILRASAHGPVQLMLPMLTNNSELTQSLHLIEQCKNELRQSSLPFDEEMPIGGMIEVPAAAISAEAFARQLQFLSIGTNDLIQYTLAIDRIDDQVNYLFDPLHPAVLYLIHHTLAAGRKTGTPVSLCGEMASNPRMTRLLLGLGLREFSTHPNALLEIKRIVNQVSADTLQGHCQKILKAPPEQIHDLVEALNRH